MYAVIQTGGKQFEVKEQMRLRVPTVDAPVGKVIDLNDVLLVSTDNDVMVGTPILSDASVKAEVLGHGRDKKIIVVKYKRRKNYKRKKGHRQGYTELLIKSIDVTSSAKPKIEKTEKEEVVEQTKIEAKVEGDTLACDVCGKEYKTERGLTSHVEREHQ